MNVPMPAMDKEVDVNTAATIILELTTATVTMATTWMKTAENVTVRKRAIICQDQ